MQIKGKLCEDLGLKYPIFQGGMAIFPRRSWLRRLATPAVWV